MAIAATTADTEPRLGFSRRLFLSRAPAVAGAALMPVTVAAASVVPAAPAALAAFVSQAREAEDPALLEIGVKLADAQSRYAAARARLAEARAKAEELCPPLPADLRVTGPSFLCPHALEINAVDLEVDIMGAALPRPIDANGLPGRLSRVVTTDYLRRRAKCVLQGRKLLQEINRLLPIAERYEIEREAAIDAADLDGATEEEYFAGRDICILVEETSTIEARTIVGLLIKAQVMAAGFAVDDGSGRGCFASARNSEDLAASVVRVIGGAL